MEKTKSAGESSDSLVVDDFTFETVNSFAYLGSIINVTNTTSE